jgi:hypothetical protein
MFWRRKGKDFSRQGVARAPHSPGEAPSRARKKRHWPRRLLFLVAAVVLIAAVALGLLLADLRKIVMRSLQASLPDFRVSLEGISLRSLSRLEVVGLELKSPGGGSVVRFPRVDVRFRLSLSSGLTFEKLDLQNVEAILGPEVQAFLRPPSKPAAKARLPEAFPPGPPIGRISLKNSRIVFNTPDLKFNALLDATADSSLTGTLLNETDFSLRLRVASLETEPVKVRNLDTVLSAFVNRDATGKRIDVLRGRLHMGDFLQSNFRGSLSYGVTGLETRGSLRTEPFSAAELLSRLKEPFPELGAYEVDGTARGELEVLYIPDDRNETVLSGNVLVRQGRVVIPLVEVSKGSASGSTGQALTGPVVAEDLGVDLPFRLSVVDGKATVLLGSREEHLAGATLVAGRVTYGEEEVASNLLALFELEGKLFGASPGKAADVSGSRAPDSFSASESELAVSLPTAPTEASGETSTGQDDTSPTATGRCRAFFRSHGGSISAEVSGALRGDLVEVQGDLDLQKVDLEKVFPRLGLADYGAWGPVSGTARVACAAGRKTPLKLSGELSVRVPQAVISLGKPVTFTGLEVRAPFEYSPSSGVEGIRIKESNTYPSGGDVTAVKVGYGEKVAEDGTSSAQWMVSGVSANIVSTADGVNLTLNSCEAYDGDVAGDITLSLGKNVLRYGARLHLQNLDLERLMKGLGIKREKFYMDGLAQGSIAASGKDKKWHAVHGEFSSIPPGGVIRVEDIEKLMDSVPAAKSVLESLKGGRTPAQWNRFIEGMKEFRYKVAQAKVTFPPETPRPEGGTGPDIELHLEGTGAGEDFVITVQIPITFHGESVFSAEPL